MMFEFARTVFAVTGIVATVYAVYRVARYFLQARGDDAPIRVKGGSIRIENTKYPWVVDQDDDAHKDTEYHSAGRVNSLRVVAYKSKADETAGKPTLDRTGRTAIVQMENSSGFAFRVRFRGNGAVRVIDPMKRLQVNASDPNLLEQLSTDNWIGLVVVRDGGVIVDKCTFTSGDKPIINMTPQ